MVSPAESPNKLTLPISVSLCISLFFISWLAYSGLSLEAVHGQGMQLTQSL